MMSLDIMKDLESVLWGEDDAEIDTNEIEEAFEILKVSLDDVCYAIVQALKNCKVKEF